MLIPPLHQQVTAKARGAGRRQFAYFMEQGTGKTYVTLDESETFYREGFIDRLLIVALNGVHRNWTEIEIPICLEVPHISVLWESKRAKQRGFLDRFEEMMASKDRLKILAVNVEAFQQSTSAAVKMTERFLKAGPALFGVDESDTIKSPSATRTKVTWRLGRLAAYRRILTGTPLSETPLQAYAQFKFLGPELLGFNNYAVFKAYFAEWVTRTTKAGQSYDEIKRYRNLDELKRLIDANSYTVRKKDCLDLPPKVYQQRLVEMGEEQGALYRAAQKELVVQLQAGTMTLAHALTRIIRLSQITGGFYASDDENACQPIPGENAKVNSLVSYTNDLPGDVKTIIWCQFVHECRAVAEALGLERTARFWGEIPPDLRAEGAHRFQHDDTIKYIVATARAGGRGNTWHRASQVVYFSNTFSSADRLQSEDRPHRIGQVNAVTYTDLMCHGTVDVRKYKTLMSKKSLAETFSATGTDAILAWLEAQ